MSVGRNALKSTLYTSVNTYASLGLTLISTVVMARILEPSDFGVVALANFFLAFFGRIKEFGLDFALIHKQDELEEAFRTHFTLQLTLSLLNLMLVLIASPWLLNFYSQEVVWILIIFSVFAIFQAISKTPRLFLEKELAFGRTTVVDVVSLGLSIGLGISSALLGLGLWSLVVLNVSGIIFSSVGLFIVSSWVPKLSFNKKMIKWFLRFGFFLWIGAVTTFIVFQYNDFILGTFLGAAVLGYYSKAFQIAQLPTSLVTAVVSKVALPTYAKLQSDSEKLSIAFNLVLRNIFRISTPFSIFLFLVASDFIQFLLGEKWLPMVPLFQLLLVYSMLRPIFDDTGAFLTAIGQPQAISKYLTIQAIVLLVLTPLLVLLYQERGAALSINLVMLLGVVLAYGYANKFIKIQYKEIFLPTLLAGLLTALVLVSLTTIFPVQNLALFYRLIVKTIIIVCSYSLFVFLLERNKIKEDIGLFMTIFRGASGKN